MGRAGIYGIGVINCDGLVYILRDQTPSHYPPSHRSVRLCSMMRFSVCRQREQQTRLGPAKSQNQSKIRKLLPASSHAHTHRRTHTHVERIHNTNTRTHEKTMLGFPRSWKNTTLTFLIFNLIEYRTIQNFIRQFKISSFSDKISTKIIENFNFLTARYLVFFNLEH